VPPFVLSLRLKTALMGHRKTRKRNACQSTFIIYFLGELFINGLRFTLLPFCGIIE